MPLEEKIVQDRIEIVGEFNYVNVRTATIILKDGVEIARKHHRKVLIPGDSTDAESEDVKKICNILHTPEFVDDFKNKMEERKRQRELEKEIKPEERK